ncbi:MAG: hypothetical protein HFJ17_06265 [Clostridia bacterium]|nr:hypothetical protein [Clostridia bacterium]
MQRNNIYFISSRLLNIPGCDTKRITKDTLEKGNIQYDELIIGIWDKLNICKDKKIDIFIDDSLYTCMNLQKNGIKTYLMTTNINKELDSKDIERVNHWNDIRNKLKKAY